MVISKPFVCERTALEPGYFGSIKAIECNRCWNWHLKKSVSVMCWWWSDPKDISTYLIIWTRPDRSKNQLYETFLSRYRPDFRFFISVIHSPKPIQAKLIHNGPGSSVNTDLNWNRMKSWNRLQAVRENLIEKRELYEFHKIKNFRFWMQLFTATITGCYIEISKMKIFYSASELKLIQHQLSKQN